MKAALFLFTVLMFILAPKIALAQWTHYAEEGEDATSTHYYFFETNKGSVQRVRWVWNGGAQNLPTVTDYVLEKQKLTVRHSVGKRQDLKKLIAGRDAALDTKTEYSIMVKSSGRMLIPAPSNKPPTDAQRTDINNLNDLLTMERRPLKSAN